MRAIMVQKGSVEGLNGIDKLSDKLTVDQKKEMMGEAPNSNEKTTKDVWEKQEQFYLAKTLANRLFLKQRLYSFKMNEDKFI